MLLSPQNLSMKILTFLPLIFLSTFAIAQELTIIKATSKRVDVKDGDELDKNAWALSPKTRPDVFTANRTHKNKYVTFYTDIDSIKVKVTPGSRYDFIILLNGRDSCYTRIESAIPPEEKVRPGLAIHDTIPFIRTAHEAISFKAVVNETDTVVLHFVTGSWDVRLTKDAIVKKTKLLSNQPEYVAGKAAPDFHKLNKVFKLQIGKLIINNPGFVATDMTAHDMDGRFGWNLFEGKQVEMDYDRNVMIVHSGKLIKAPKGYVKTPLEFNHSFMIVKGAMKKGKEKFSGEYLMDTGAETAIILDSMWAAQADFGRDLPLMKTISISDPRGVKYETKVVQAPAFTMNGFELTRIPTLILGTRNPVGYSLNYLGGDVLKRFNYIIDFKNDCIYWKPNTLFNIAYNKI